MINEILRILNRLESSQKRKKYNQFITAIIQSLRKLTLKQNDYLLSNEWTRLCLLRLNRTLDEFEELERLERAGINHGLNPRYPLVKSLANSLVNMNLLLSSSDSNYKDSLAWKQFIRSMNFELELENRTQYFKQMYGQQKTFDELYIKHSTTLRQYLKTIISFHHKLSLLPFSGSVEILCEQLFHNPNIILSEIMYKRLSDIFNHFEIYLDRSSTQMSELSSIQIDSNIPFIPTVDDSFNQNRQSRILNCVTAISENRWMVILGDAGSGKTTLLRWITLHFTRTALERRKCVKFDNIHVGPPRIPILIRLGEYAEWIQEHGGSSLIEYIGKHTWYGNKYFNGAYDKCLHDFLIHGHAFILLDGLDELSSSLIRGKISDHVSEFIANNIRSPAQIASTDSNDVLERWSAFSMEAPKFCGGNQVIVTSRTAGYRSYPVKGDALIVCSDLRMNSEDFDRFIHRFFSGIQKAIDSVTDQFFSQNTTKKQMNLAVKDKIHTLKKILVHTDDNCYSNPMILLLLCINCLKMRDLPKLYGRVSLYNEVVSMVLDANQLSLKSDAVLWLYCDIAAHLQYHSSSGLIDKFDFLRLIHVSLIKFHTQKSSDLPLKTQVKNVVREITNNGTVFVARGLDTFGFIHKSYQEYFVAMTLIRSLNTNTNNMELLVIKLCNHVNKPNFRAPLIMAIEWIQLKSPEMNVESFYQLLVQRKVGLLPIGSLLLLEQFECIQIMPSDETMFAIFDILLPNYAEYLARGLACLNEKFLDRVQGMICKYLEQANRCKLFCQCIILSCQTTLKSVYRFVAYIVSVHMCEKLYSLFNDTSESEKVVDFAMRNVATGDQRKLYFIEEDLPAYLLKRNITTSMIHPVILSLLIILYGGLFPEIRKNGRVINFSPRWIHRTSTLSSQLIEYFENETCNHQIKIKFLIVHCEKTVRHASLNDTSALVVDSLIALLCLCGTEDLTFYMDFFDYDAFSLALTYYKRVLLHLRDDYSSYVTSESTILNISCLLQEYITETKLDDSCFIPFFKSILIAIPSLVQNYTQTLKDNQNSTVHIFLPEILMKDMDRLSRVIYDKDLLGFIFKSKSDTGFASLHDVFNTEQLEKINHSNKAYQLYDENPFFLTIFIPEYMQPLYCQLIVTNRLVRNRIDDGKQLTLLQIVLLAEVMVYITTACSLASNEYQMLLCILEKAVTVHNLKDYVLAAISELFFRDNLTKSKKDEAFIETNFELFSKIKSRRSFIDNISDTQEKDIQLFDISICLTHFCPYQKILLDEYFNELHQVAMDINDAVLRVYALRTILNSRPDLQAKHGEQLMSDIENSMKNLPPSLPLLISTILIAGCTNFYNTVVWEADYFLELLEKIPLTEEEARDQEVSYIALRNFFSMKDYIPKSFLKRKTLSFVLNLSSHPFLIHLNRYSSLDSSNIALLSSIYISLLAIDVQHLNHIRNAVSGFMKQKNLTHETLWLFRNLKLNCVNWSNEIWFQKFQPDEDGATTPLSMNFVDDMTALLVKEKERLRFYPSIDKNLNIDESYFRLIQGCDVRVEEFIMQHILEQVEMSNPNHDAYTATILTFASKCYTIRYNPIFHSKLIICLFNEGLPLTQTVAAHSLAINNADVLLSVISEQLSILETVDTTISLSKVSECILIICIRALSHKSVVCNKDLLKKLLTHCSEQTISLVVSTAAIACSFSHMDLNHRTLQNFRKVFSLDVDFSYDVFKLGGWNDFMGTLIEENWSHLIHRFIMDIFTNVKSERLSLHSYSNSEINYLKVAQQLCLRDRKKFCHAVNVSSFGKEKFIELLYKISMCDDICLVSCIHLCMAFGTLTHQLVDMLFISRRENIFSSIDLKKIESVDDREAIECIFPYLMSSSVGKCTFAAQLLVHLVEVGSMSAIEVHGLLDEVIDDPCSMTIDDTERWILSPNTVVSNLRQLALKLTCIEQIEMKVHGMLIPTARQMNQNIQLSRRRCLYKFNI